MPEPRPGARRATASSGASTGHARRAPPHRLRQEDLRDDGRVGGRSVAVTRGFRSYGNCLANKQKHRCDHPMSWTGTVRRGRPSLRRRSGLMGNSARDHAELRRSALSSGRGPRRAIGPGEPEHRNGFRHSTLDIARAEPDLHEGPAGSGAGGAAGLAPEPDNRARLNRPARPGPLLQRGRRSSIACPSRRFRHPWRHGANDTQRTSSWQRSSNSRP